MKSAGIYLYFCLFFLYGVHMYAQDTKYLIEAEDFQFKGRWIVEKDNACFSNYTLRVLEKVTNTRSIDALSVIDIKPGNYSVWVRSFDHKYNPGTRLFQLIIDDTPMKESGKHGREGFYWENVGQVNLKKEQILLKIRDTGQYHGRCDAIALISDHTIDPNEKEKAEIEKWRQKPVNVKTFIENESDDDKKPDYTVLLKVWLPKDRNIINTDYAGSVISLYGMHYSINDDLTWASFNSMPGKEETKFPQQYKFDSEDGDIYLEWNVTDFVESRKKIAGTNMHFRLDLEDSNKNAMVNLAGLRYDNPGEYNLYFPFLKLSNDSTPTTSVATTIRDEDEIYIFPTKISSVLNDTVQNFV